VKESREIIDEVEAMGGMIKAIESGMAKLKIEEAATKKQVIHYFWMHTIRLLEIVLIIVLEDTLIFINHFALFLFI